MPTLYLITGDDGPSIEVRARKLVTELAGEDADAFTLEIIKETPDISSDAAMRQLLQSLRTPSFLGAQKTVWLQNFSAFDDEPAKSKKSKDLSPTARFLRELGDFIESEFPDDINLVMNGLGVDKRKRLFKVCSDVGKVEELKKPELKSWQWREQVSGLIQMQAAERQMKLDRHTVEYLLEVIGVETGRIPMEMEKILCYSGQTPTLAQVREICSGNRDAYFFALSDALGKRKLNDALEALSQTMAHAKNEDSECIRLIRQTANYFRKLLHAKIASAVMKAEGKALPNALKRMTDVQKRRLEGNLILSMGNWQAGNTAEQATNYRGDELQKAIAMFGDADRSMVSSGLPRRLVLEMLIVQVVKRDKAA